MQLKMLKQDYKQQQQQQQKKTRLLPTALVTSCNFLERSHLVTDRFCRTGNSNND